VDDGKEMQHYQIARRFIVRERPMIASQRAQCQFLALGGGFVHASKSPFLLESPLVHHPTMTDDRFSDVPMKDALNE
jgi:hypothetical protein